MSSSQGKLYEDFGSSGFTSSQSKPRGPGATRVKKSTSSQYTGKAKPPTSSKNIVIHDSSADSDDEMDLLSQHGSDAYDLPPKKSKTKYVDAGGNKHEYDKDYLPDKAAILKSLRFKKKSELDPASSQESAGKPDSRKENGKKSHVPLESAGVASTGSQSKLSSTARSSTSSRILSEGKMNRKQIDLTSDSEKESTRMSESRPKARPKNVPTKVKVLPASSNSSPNTPKPRKKSSSKTLAPFPMDSSQSSAQFTPGKSSPKSHSFPQTSPLGTSNAPVKKQLAQFPSMSPLGKSDASKSKAERKGKAKAPASFPELSPLRTSQSSTEYRSLKRDVLERFPMETHDLGSGSSSSPSRSGKRLSDGGDSRSRKRLKEEDRRANLDRVAALSDENEDDNVFISPETDPKTLCPYCDEPLPDSPTPLLLRLIAGMKKKSYSAPRPSNPLGRKAPLTAFIGVCQRHRFESQTLPEAEAKGWPKSICWDKLSSRVEKMKDDLAAIITDPDDTDDNDDDDDMMIMSQPSAGPRTKCVFWREVRKQLKKQGSKSLAGVSGQFASFDKTQPGYYGELGASIIQQTLYNLFPLDAFDADLVAPLTPRNFVERVLVPEVAARLVMEDRDLTGIEGMMEAVAILRASARFGVAMFPEDGGDWDERSKSLKAGDEEDIGVADMILIERARRRRQEIEVEEQEEASNKEERRPRSRARSETRERSRIRGRSTVSLSSDEDMSGNYGESSRRVSQRATSRARGEPSKRRAVSRVRGRKTSPSSSPPPVTSRPRPKPKLKARVPDLGTTTSDMEVSSEPDFDLPKPLRPGGNPSRPNSRSSRLSSDSGSDLEVVSSLKTPKGVSPPSDDDDTPKAQPESRLASRSLKERPQEISVVEPTKKNSNSWLLSSDSDDWDT